MESGRASGQMDIGEFPKLIRGTLLGSLKGLLYGNYRGSFTGLYKGLECPKIREYLILESLYYLRVLYVSPLFPETTHQAFE